ncbi:unnamed protein product [Caenorhabditis auriculariae]|uniref:C2H2-type domain-containing protein n=1 Tax=Caenorhabditis auriculariae TaxID=2777116 RepID=A0A8S1HN50_9PELO|nr:unnamed protein product [Caenorhabditis auriculariae]
MLETEVADDGPSCQLCSFPVKGVEHFYNHFNYGRYGCRTCSMEFTSPGERKKHCDATNHIPSIRTSVNEYIEFISEVMFKDCQFLLNIELAALLEMRKKYFTNANSKLSKILCTSLTNRPIQIPSLIPSDITTQTEQVLDSANDVSYLDGNILNVSADINTSLPADQTILVNGKIVSPQKKTRKNKSTEPTASFTEEAAREPPRQEQIGELEDVGFSPETASLAVHLNPATFLKSNLAEVKCLVCKKPVANTYLDRKHHVTLTHIAADVAEEDYVDVVMEKMERAFPGMPNNDFSCQFCGKEVRNQNGRKDHVERTHAEDIPEMICPIKTCAKPFSRHAEMFTHLKTVHRCGFQTLPISTVASNVFNENRKQRNFSINNIVAECFPCGLPPNTRVRTTSASVTTTSLSELTKNLNSGRLAQQPNPPRRIESDSSSSSDDEDSKQTGEGRKSRQRLNQPSTSTLNSPIKNSPSQELQNVPKEEASEGSFPVDAVSASQSLLSRREPIYPSEEELNTTKTHTNTRHAVSTGRFRPSQHRISTRQPENLGTFSQNNFEARNSQEYCYGSPAASQRTASYAHYGYGSWKQPQFNEERSAPVPLMGLWNDANSRHVRPRLGSESDVQLLSQLYMPPNFSHSHSSAERGTQRLPNRKKQKGSEESYEISGFL